MPTGRIPYIYFRVINGSDDQVQFPELDDFMASRTRLPRRPFARMKNRKLARFGARSRLLVRFFYLRLPRN